MADVLISTAPGTTEGVARHLDAVGAWNKAKETASTVQLSIAGVVRFNDMNWKLERVEGSARIAPLMWFRDAGTHNTSGPKVLQLTKDGVDMKVVVKGDEQIQPSPAVTSWMIAAQTSDDVRALAATISQKIDDTAWFLKNEGEVGDHTDAHVATASTSWYLQPSRWAPENLQTFLDTVIDGTGGSLKAGDAILRMWNGIANTGWDNVLAPPLLAWLYDFSTMYLKPNATDPFDKTALENTLYAGLYKKSAEYKTYFDSFAAGSTPVSPPPGFGTGDPPTANPPQAPHPHKHPPRPHK